MRWRSSSNTPCSPLQHTGTCAVKMLNLTCGVHLSPVSGLPSSKKCTSSWMICMQLVWKT